MTAAFPTRQLAFLARHTETTNGMGDPAIGHLPAEEVMVIGWALTGGVERGEDGHILQVSWDAVCYAPAILQVDAQDQMVLPGVGKFEVADSPSNWDTGPWWQPRMSEIKLRRIDGS